MLKNDIAQLPEGWGAFSRFISFQPDQSYESGYDDSCLGDSSRDPGTWSYDLAGNVLRLQANGAPDQDYIVKRLDSLTLILHRINLPDGETAMYNDVYRRLK